MISAVLAGLLALGIIGPFNAFGASDGSVSGRTLNILAERRPLTTGQNMEAKPAFVIVPENAPIDGATTNIKRMRILDWRTHNGECLTITGLHNVFMGWFGHRSIRIYGIFRHLNLGADVQRYRPSDILASQREYQVSAFYIYNFQLRLNSGALRGLHQYIGVPCFSKGSPYKRNPYDAKDNRRQSGPEHLLGPISRLFLRLQIPDFALVPLFFVGIIFGILGFKCIAYAADTRRDIGILGGVFIALCGGGLASGVVTHWLSITN